jgi:hypothetical protein
MRRMMAMVSIVLLVHLMSSISHAKPVSREQLLLKIAALRVWLSRYETAAPATREQLSLKLESLRKRLNRYERSYLSPSSADKAKYAKQVKMPGWGLIRLIPRAVNDDVAIITLRGGGAYYSFTKLTHEYNYGSDIELQNGVFSVGFAGADYGMMTTLGDVPLHSINIESPGVVYLANWKTPLKISEARGRQRESGNGIEQEGYAYKDRVGAVVGNTYALRSINYDRSDVLVGFRVVRKDKDGSLIVLWKMLKEYPPPILVRDKVE